MSNNFHVFHQSGEYSNDISNFFPERITPFVVI